VIWFAEGQEACPAIAEKEEEAENGMEDAYAQLVEAWLPRLISPVRSGERRFGPAPIGYRTLATSGY